MLSASRLFEAHKSRPALKSMNLNFGPQHPAAHGVLRLVLQLNNETVWKSDVHIGLLHRGTEKLIETKPYLLSLPYFDRLDYVSVLVQEHAFCLAIEKLKRRANFVQRTSYTRTIFDELTRILNHLLAISCHALDVGSMSPLFWAFEEREVLMGFYEGVSGARVHAAYYRPTQGSGALNTDTYLAILRFVSDFKRSSTEILNVLNDNSIWKQRLVNVGAYSQAEVRRWGLTGVMARCTGVKSDARLLKNTTYGNYYFLHPDSYTGTNGDSYDRYLIRTAEMLESTALVAKSISRTHPTPHRTTLRNRELWQHETIKSDQHCTTMEDTITHFKYWSEGESIPQGVTTQVVESPKGMFAATLFADGTSTPYRCKIRSPAYNHIQFLPQLLRGTLLADLVTLIGTVDIVFGEIDR